MTHDDKAPFLIRRQARAHGVPESWAVSYSDLITQLLVFFVVIVSSSNVSNAKFEQVQQAIKGVVAVTPPIERIAQDLSTTLAKHGLSDFVNVTADADGITMVIKDSLLFASGEAAIATTNQAKLDPVFVAFLELPAAYNFSVEGHTDDDPIHTSMYPSNWHLSAARALAVLGLFESHGIKQDRLSVRAFGDQRPLVPNRDPTGQPLPQNMQTNRRVVIRVR